MYSHNISFHRTSRTTHQLNTGQNLYSQSPSTSTDSLCAIKRVDSPNPLSASSSQSQLDNDNSTVALSDLSQERISLDCIHNGLFITDLADSAESLPKTKQKLDSYTLDRNRRVSSRRNNSDNVNSGQFVSTKTGDHHNHHNQRAHSNSLKRTTLNDNINDNNINRVNIVQASDDLTSIGGFNKLINVVNVSSGPESLLNSFTERQQQQHISVARNHQIQHNDCNDGISPVRSKADRQTMYQQVADNLAKDDLPKDNSSRQNGDCEFQQQQRQQSSESTRIMSCFGDQSSSHEQENNCNNHHQQQQAYLAGNRSTNGRKKSGNNSEVNILAYV